MYVKTEKKNILKAVAKLVEFVPSSAAGKSILVHLSVNENGSSLALSYPEVTFITRFESEHEGHGTYSLYGRRFFEILKNSEHTVSFKAEEHNLVIRSHKTMWKERLLKTSLQQLSVPEGSGEYFNAEEMAEAMKVVGYCSSPNTTRPSFYTLDVSGGKVRASDGVMYQETRVKNKASFAVTNNLVSAVMKIFLLWKTDVKLLENDSHYFFQHGSDTLVLSKYSADFPDLDKLLIRTLRKTALYPLRIRKQDLLNGIKKIAIVLDESLPCVELHVTQKECLVRGVGEAGAEAVCAVEAAWSGHPRVLTFLAPSLQKCISAQKDEVLTLLLAKDTAKKKSPMVVDGAVNWAFINQLKVRTR